MGPATGFVFAAMSELARRTGSINLGQGVPDGDAPARMLADAVQRITDGGNQYAPLGGMPDLRAAIARQRKRRYGIDVSPDTEVVVTAGVTEAVTAAVLATCDAEAEMVVFDPVLRRLPGRNQIRRGASATRAAAA